MNLLTLINTFTKVLGYKFNMQKLVAFQWQRYQKRNQRNSLIHKSLFKNLGNVFSEFLFLFTLSFQS